MMLGKEIKPGPILMRENESGERTATLSDADAVKKD